MARVKKWIYSWELYVNFDDEWLYLSKSYTHKSYKRIRKFVNKRHGLPTKWVECRKPNPEYKGV